MFKNKVLIGLMLSILILGTAAIVIASQDSKGRQKEFDNSGYILTASEEATVNKYLFASKTKITNKYPELIQFRDVQGTKITIQDDNFVHYDDNVISTLKKGVLVNLDEVGSDYINNYSIPAQMLLQKGSDSYTLETGNGSVPLDNFLLKVNDNKCIVCSDTISIEFGPDDVREVNGFVEVKYIDKGIVQLVTSENVWHTISLSAKAKLANGVEFVFSEKKLVGENGELPLTNMLIDSDDNIEVLISATDKDAEIKVPKFDIKTIDGEDGEIGEAGEVGEAGLPGEVGEAGEAGEAGTSGDAGEAGEAGDAGESGEIGTQGASGKKGSSGGAGGSGALGADGLDGTTSGGEDTSKEILEMPIFQITEWEVTASSVTGKIEVQDEGFLLGKEGAMNIIEVGTDTVIPVENDLGSGAYIFDFGQLSVEFSHIDLKPDTQYRLVVTSNYTVDDKEYTRDFISRVFYTDSIGVFLSKGVIEKKAVAININRANYSLAENVDVYLLTENENSNFDPEDDENTYLVAHVAFSNSSNYEVSFSNLSANTNYVVRMVTSRILEGGTTPVATLSDFELVLKTLKRDPTIGNPLVIQVISNGTFQLSLDSVLDPDNGIKTFRYEIYDISGATPALIKTITSASKEAVTLYVDGVIERNKNYKLKIVTEFYDNEKTVEFTTDFSDPFMMISSSLPTVFFTTSTMNPSGTVGGITFNSLSGILTVQKTTSEIDATNHPIKVIIEAPGYFYKVYDLTIIDVNITADGNIEIPVTEDGLLEGEYLRMTVWGYVDLNDGRGFISRMIGSVVQQIKTPQALSISWLEGDDTFAIDKYVQLSAPTSGTGEALYSIDYEAAVLGEITISIYEGTGTNKRFLKSVTEKNTNTTSNTNSSLKTTFYQSQYRINEDTFNLTAQQLQASSYTLEVTSIYDYTYDVTSPLRNEGNISGYKNAIPIISGTQTTVVYKKSSPPPIANSGISVVPILNTQANQYGATVNANLEGTTVIGFKATSQYDNYANLAKSITYYAFDQEAYDGFVNGGTYADPIKADLACYKTPEISIGNSVSMPSVVFLMGGTEGYSKTLSDGTMVYNTGVYNNGTGMQRGRKYYFAYTADYGVDGASAATMEYPYDAEGYVPGFVLHTSVANAPRQSVKFDFYPWTSTQTDYDWKYRFIDPDGALDTGRQFTWSNNNVNGINTSFIGTVENTWYAVTFGSQANQLTSDTQLNVYTQQNLYVYSGSTTTLNLLATPFSGIKSLNTTGITVEMDTSRVAQNVIDFTVTGPTASIRNIAALKLNFSKGATSIDVYRALGEINIVGSTATAELTMPLSSIAALSGQTGITVTASFLYDDGKTGYNGITSGEPYALQVVNATSFGQYKAKTATGNTLANYNYISGSAFKFTGVFPSINHNGITSSTSGQLSLAYSQSGMTYSGGTVLNEILVPKHLETVGNLQISTDFELVGIVPTIIVYDQTDITQYIDKIDIRFQIEGQINIDLNDGARYVTFDVYEGVVGSGGNVSYPTLTKTFNIPVTTSTSTYTTTLNALVANKKYLVIAKASLSNNPVTLIKGDSDTNALAWYYTGTLSDISITITKFSYFARSYMNKGYDLSYTLSQLTGFDIKYAIVKVNSDNTETMVYTHEQLVSEGIIIEHSAGSTYSSPYQKTFNFTPGTDLEFGFNYKLYITAYAKSDASYKLSEVSRPFTRYTTQPPSYYVLATPEQTDIGLNKITFRVTIADPDKVIVGNEGSNWYGLYKVRFYDGNNDITPIQYKNNVYSVNVSSLFALDNLVENKGYIIKIYTAYDMENMGVINDISTVSLESDLINPTNNYLKYEKIGETMDANGVQLGTVTLGAQTSNKDKVTVDFINGVNLDRIALVEYSITNTSGTVFGDQIANPTIVKVDDSYSYLDLPDTLPQAGTYFVTIRFKTATGNVIDTLSFVYNRR